MKIRKTAPAELEQIMTLYEHARFFMADNGNPSQWGSTYPPCSLVQTDIENGDSYVCEDQGRIIATFYYKDGPDPTYQQIEEGCWLNGRPYGTVHRITSDGSVRGAASYCLNWAFAQCGNLKIDTHRDNHIMQHLLAKNGFQYCGIIRTDDGSERLAYQKTV